MYNTHTHTHTQRERGEASNLCSILVENEEKGRQRGMNDDQSREEEERRRGRERQFGKMRSMIRVTVFRGLEAAFALSEEELDLFSERALRHARHLRLRLLLEIFSTRTKT